MCLIHLYEQRAAQYAPSALPADPFIGDADGYIAHRSVADEDAQFYDLVLDLLACGAIGLPDGDL